ncbi:MAG: hypothetical protein P8J32_04840 [bacterium]|nr:hypothetical protein [bacterium]
MKLIQLDGVDGDHVALFEYDPHRIQNVQDAIGAIELAMKRCKNEENPLDAAEGLLEKELGITRVYVDYANTDVI